MSRGVAVVTGAGSGIGRAVALGLALAGHNVVAADRDLAGAQATAEEGSARATAEQRPVGAVTAEEAPGLMAAHVDVADPASVADLEARVRDEVGPAYILVNAAGWDRTGAFLDNTREFIEAVVAINYLGPVEMCRRFLPGMVEAGHGGKVVNIASDAGRVGSSGESVYAGAKGGVIALTKSLAREMARYSINVNCVCPGPTDTPLFAAQSEAIKQALIKAIPFRRLARPEEVAAAVLFLASDDASFITGQVISVSGGLTMAG